MGTREAVIVEDTFVRATARLGWDTQCKYILYFLLDMKFDNYFHLIGDNTLLCL